MTAEPSATGRHTSTGRSTPQNDRAAITNPTSDAIQNALASVLAVSAGRVGMSQVRAAAQSPVLEPGRNRIQSRAPSAPP